MKKTCLTILIYLFTSQLFATEVQASYCSSFVKSVESSFAKGIDLIEEKSPHLAYDTFGETLMRLRAESKFIRDCQPEEKEQMIRLKEKSAHTLTALRGQMSNKSTY